MLAVIVVSWIWAFPGWAYVLEGPHILGLMVDRLGAAESLFVSQKLIFHRVGSPAQTAAASEKTSIATDNAGAGLSSEVTPPIPASDPSPEMLELDESVRYIFPRAFRSDAKSLVSERIYVFAAGRTLTIIDGYIVDDAGNQFELYKDLLLNRSRPGLCDRLTWLGVDVSVSSLGRFEGKIAFVVGADYPDETVPQVWVDKETLLPMRWIIQAGSGGSGTGSLEVRYLDWWRIGKIRYPSRIEFYQDGNLVRESRAIDLKENVRFSEALFDVDYLQTVYLRQVASPAEEEQPGQSSEVQKAIQEFQNLFD